MMILVKVDVGPCRSVTDKQFERQTQKGVGHSTPTHSETTDTALLCGHLASAELVDATTTFLIIHTYICDLSLRRVKL